MHFGGCGACWCSSIQSNLRTGSTPIATAVAGGSGAASAGQACAHGRDGWMVTVESDLTYMLKNEKDDESFVGFFASGEIHTMLRFLKKTNNIEHIKNMSPNFTSMSSENGSPALHCIALHCDRFFSTIALHKVTSLLPFVLIAVIIINTQTHILNFCLNFYSTIFPPIFTELRSHRTPFFLYSAA